MPEDQKDRQPALEINGYLNITGGFQPTGLRGPVKSEEVAKEVLDAISKKAKGLVEVVSAYSSQAYKIALSEIFNLLVSKGVTVHLLNNLEAYLRVKKTQDPTVYMLSEEHIDFHSETTFAVMRNILGGEVESQYRNGILVLGITHATIDMVMGKDHIDRTRSDIFGKDYAIPHSRLAGLGFITFSLPLAVAAAGLVDSSGFSHAYSTPLMGFWIVTSIAAVILLLLGFTHLNTGRERISILSLSIFLLFNLVALTILGPGALSVSVLEYPQAPLASIYGAVSITGESINMLLQAVSVVFSVAIIYTFLPENLKKISISAMLLGIASIAIDAIALIFYAPRLSNFVQPSLPQNISFLSYFGNQVFLHPSLSLGASVYTLNYFQIYVSIPVTGFALAFNALTLLLYFRIGIGMISGRRIRKFP